MLLVKVGDYLRERQKQGVNIAKVNGTYTGRLYGTKMNDEQLLEKYNVVVKELKENAQSLRRAALLGGWSLGTAQKIKKIIEENAKKLDIFLWKSLP